MNEVSIRTEYIKLDTFLKLADCISTGGSAKILIAEGLIKVNGENEERRGRKLYPGDTVEVDGEDSFKVVREG
ncbi:MULTISPECIES: S4 domain-containing protein YaaA [Saccharibacillus]|uniref:S4 domain-containing protein YaaA n=1 Tax=Saccharibacillus brassicae TaxID=2583377 RepID=A0A4Y6V5E4_SACBS|nr:MULTISPECIES: S4 domain-containing protein YaaA [Saccharibacillus]MWJ30051.1 S4 domain-containing protein YaaA [Saccharibacillus sp. WB 17]QDH23737.1 S4 domain-containing protein YaaA [Saccharibacillus brassicae]